MSRWSPSLKLKLCTSPLVLYRYSSASQPPDGQEEEVVRICKYTLYFYVTVEWKIPDRGACVFFHAYM